MTTTPEYVQWHTVDEISAKDAPFIIVMTTGAMFPVDGDAGPLIDWDAETCDSADFRQKLRDAIERGDPHLPCHDDREVAAGSRQPLRRSRSPDSTAHRLPRAGARRLHLREPQRIRPRERGDSMQRSWHLTDKRDFRLDPSYRPENNTTLGGDWPHQGIFVSPHPSAWFDGHGYCRPYVAEIEHPPLGDFGGYSSENFLPATAFEQAQVKRVIPFYQWQKETFGDGHEGLEVDDGDVRGWTSKQDAAYKERLNQWVIRNCPDALRSVCPKCADDYVAPGKPCPRCGYETDWDGRLYSSHRTAAPADEGW